MLTETLRQTITIGLGTLIENPVKRNPAVSASSIATVDDLDPRRIHSRAWCRGHWGALNETETRDCETASRGKDSDSITFGWR